MIKMTQTVLKKLCDKEHTCCFTGHRDLTEEEKYIAERRIRTLVKAFYEMGVTDFIAGGAIGFDTVAAATVINMKRSGYPKLRLAVAIPFRDQSERWSSRNKALYRTILEAADETVCLNENYTSSCMMERNMFMVDNSSFCISYVTRQSGGSWNTVRYAGQRGINIINLAEADW